LLAQTQHGLFVNETEISHEEAMNQMHNNTEIDIHDEQLEGESSSSECSDDNDSVTQSGEELEASSSREDRLNDVHEPVSVPDTTNPFSDEDLLQVFTTALATVREEGMLPEGYGLLPEEWDDEEYPSYWVIKSGRRGKELRISLPDAQWRARSELWGQALDIVNRLTYMLDRD
jgi:hypothetical protein